VVQTWNQRARACGEICGSRYIIDLDVLFDAETRKKISAFWSNHRHMMLDLKGEVETKEGWMET